MKICAIPAGSGGVAFYRILQPYTWLKEQGADIFIFNPKEHTPDRFVKEQKEADILVFQTPWSEGVTEALKIQKYKFNKKTVVEFDDYMFGVSPWNEKYDTFGTKEAVISFSEKEDIDKYKEILKNEKDIRWKETQNKLIMEFWTDGKKGLDLKTNIAKAEATKEIIKEADLLTVTTKDLGGLYREFRKTGPILVSPNVIDSRRWLPMEKNNSKFIRIGWQGGSAHYDDLRQIIQHLEKLDTEYNNLEFVFMGIQYDSLFSKLKRVDYKPWHGDISTHSLNFRESRLDIGICPLTNDVFNKGKSPLKWLEYSISGIPTVASPIVYDNCIKQNKTGLIANNEGWCLELRRLIEDKDLRVRLGNNARTEVLENFTIDKAAKNLYKCLEDLYKGKI